MARGDESGYKVRGGIDPRSFWLAATPSPTQAQMPYVCTEAGTLYGEAPFFTRRDFKDSYLLLYTFGGAGIVRQGNRGVEVVHGQALLIDCRAPHEYGTSPKAGHWHHFWAHVEGVGVEATAHRLGLPRLTPTALSSSRVRPHFQAVFDWLMDGTFEGGERVGMATHALLSELIVASARADAPTDNPVELACAFVAERYGEQVGVEDMARAAAVSPSHLTRLFRQQMGSSPHDYLVRHRIARAKQLLMETDLPIGEVARRVGFGTQSNFSYRFSKVCGITPRAYRGLRYGMPDPARDAAPRAEA